MADKFKVGFLSLSSEKSINELIEKVAVNTGLQCVFSKITHQDLQNFHPQEPFDAVVLLHSISQGRNSITDVADAKYKKLLPQLRDKYGPDRVGMVVHSLMSFNADSKIALMMVFKKSQPTTFRCSNCVIQCNKPAEMPDQEFARLSDFLKLAPTHKLPTPSAERPVQQPPSTASSVSGSSALIQSQVTIFKEVADMKHETASTASTKRSSNSESGPKALSASSGEMSKIGTSGVGSEHTACGSTSKGIGDVSDLSCSSPSPDGSSVVPSSGGHSTKRKQTSIEEATSDPLSKKNDDSVPPTGRDYPQGIQNRQAGGSVHQNPPSPKFGPMEYPSGSGSGVQPLSYPHHTEHRSAYSAEPRNPGSCNPYPSAQQQASFSPYPSAQQQVSSTHFTSPQQQASSSPHPSAQQQVSSTHFTSEQQQACSSQTPPSQELHSGQSHQTINTTYPVAVVILTPTPDLLAMVRSVQPSLPGKLITPASQPTDLKGNWHLYEAVLIDIGALIFASEQKGIKLIKKAVQETKKHMRVQENVAMLMDKEAGTSPHIGLVRALGVPIFSYHRYHGKDAIFNKDTTKHLQDWIHQCFERHDLAVGARHPGLGERLMNTASAAYSTTMAFISP